jgi:sulfur carrier protein
MGFAAQPKRCRIRPLTEVRLVIEVQVNGAAQRFESDTDVAALLARLQLAGKRVAVERNGEIVPRSRFAQTALANGDRLEIVVAVGGG